MLSGEGIQRQKTMKNNNTSNQQKQLCTRSTLFFYISLPLFCGDQNLKLSETSQYVFLFISFHCRSFSPCIGGRSISHFVTVATKFSCCSSNKKMSPLFFISRFKSLSPFFSLSFAGLPPTFSFSLSFSCSIFQICGHDNLSKLNTLDNTDTVTISSFRFRLYCLFCCL